MEYELCFWNSNDKFIEYEVGYISSSDIIKSRQFEMKDGQPYLIINDKAIFIDGLTLYVSKTSEVFNSSNMIGRKIDINAYKKEWINYLSKLKNVAPPMMLNNTMGVDTTHDTSTRQPLKEVINDNLDNRRQLDSKTIEQMVNRVSINPIEKMESIGWKQVVFDTSKDGVLKASLKEQKKPKQTLIERRFDSAI